MADKTKGSSLKDAHDLKTVCRLRRDNFNTKNGHLWSDGSVVSIGWQNGSGQYSSIMLSKKQFNQLINKYQKHQKFVRS